MTKCPQDEIGWSLKFDHMGNLVTKEKVSKKNGTKVIVRDLFRDLTVRFIEFKKNHKNQYTKAVAMLQDYGMIATQTKLLVYNKTSEET